jgi:chromosome segregation ATPase
MNKYKLLQEVITVSLFSVTLLFYQTIARADDGKSEIAMEIQKETQEENLNFLQLEDEFLATSTDDAQLQHKEAREEATLAKQEEKAAVAKMKRTQAKKERVEAAVTPKIEKNRVIRREASSSTQKLVKKTKALEIEIAAIEKRLEKYEIKTKGILEEMKKAKENYDLLKQKRADLKEREKRAHAERKKIERSMPSKVAYQ